MKNNIYIYIYIYIYMYIVNLSALLEHVDGKATREPSAGTSELGLRIHGCGTSGAIFVEKSELVIN